MNINQCVSEKLSSRIVGIIILPFALLMAIVVNIVLPIIGTILAIPLLVLSLVLIAAPQSRVCKLLDAKLQEVGHGQDNR